MPSRVNYLKKPRLKRPILIAGLPGIAYIGKLAVEYLIHKLHAKKFAELYSEHFPEWVIREGGSAEILKVDFSSCRPDGLKRDLILATASAQASSSTGQYMLSGEILDVAEGQGADTVATMAAYAMPPREFKAKVVGAASDIETANILREHGIELMKGGTIVGMNGLLPGLAAARGLHGFCLLGTTMGGLLDVQATEGILRSISELLGFELDLRELHRHAVVLPKFKLPKFKLPEGVEEEVSYIR
jgi:hypothetical protein